MMERGETQIGGRLPVNPSGGLLTKGHPLGASGIAQMVELYWQLREDVPSQDPRRQVELRKGNALQHNVGGRGISNSVVTILSRNK
jgi:acetyl-CoA C-acetyltransferase